ncbi:hypothetical protein SRHO_G00113890 [Serrasalmus rhombeus]
MDGIRKQQSNEEQRNGRPSRHPGLRVETTGLRSQEEVELALALAWAQVQRPMEVPVHTEFKPASAGQLNPDLVGGPLPEQMEKLDRNQVQHDGTDCRD